MLLGLSDPLDRWSFLVAVISFVVLSLPRRRHTTLCRWIVEAELQAMDLLISQVTWLLWLLEP
jgi:hypothetical protein